MYSKKLRTSAILLAAMLVAVPGLDVDASNNGKTKSEKDVASPKATPAWKVNIGNNVTATLEYADVWQQGGQSTAVFTLNYKNAGKDAVRLLSYFPKVVLSGGSVRAANPISRDLGKKKVEPGQSLNVTYYVQIDKNSLAGMKLAMDVWNPNVKGYLQRVGSHRLPADYSAGVSAGTNSKLYLSGTPVTVQTASLERIKYDGKVIARVGMYITNHSSTTWTDLGFAPYLASGSGSSYPLEHEAGAAGVPIQPREKKLIYYITEIPGSLQTTNLRFLWTEADEALKLTLPVASFYMPKATTPNWDVAVGAVKKLSIQGNPVEARIRQASLRASGDQAIWSIEMAFKNKGNKLVNVPGYDLAIKAADGSVYPYNSEEQVLLSLRPGEEKTRLMQISLPLKLQQDQLKLQMVEAPVFLDPSKTPVGSAEGGGSDVELRNRLTYPIAYFGIPYQSERRASIGVEYDPQTSKGFAYRVESIQRLPWQDTDLIVAKLRLRNTGDANSLPLPELKLKLTADESVLLASPEVMAEDQGALIAPGATTEVYVMARIPYTKPIRSLRFELLAQEEKAAASFLTFTTSGTMHSIQTVENGQPYSVQTVGKRADALERRTIMYEGIDSDIIYSELTLASHEQRRVQAALLKGYFQSADGQIYEADTIQPEVLLQPGAKQSVVFWARVPKGITGEWGLALGTALSGGKLAEPGQEVSGVLGVKKLRVNPVRPSASSSLAQLEWYPYSISVTKASGSLQEGSPSILLNITIDVKWMESITAADAGHKLVMVVKDSLGQAHERTLVPGTDIQVPGTRTVSFELTDEQYKKLRGGWFNLTLLDEFQGERITLGSQSYNLTFRSIQDPNVEW